jgi:probable HAF family extracellular repeat protein
VWKQDLVLPFASTRTSARGVNNPGTVVGFFADTNFNPHGFILKGGAATQVDFPGAVGTFLEGVNDNGLATGYWTDSAGNSHAFTLDTSKGTYTSIVPPGTYANVQAFGVNDQGVVMVTTDAATGPSAFAYFADGGGYVYGARLITVHDQPSLQLAGRPTQSSSGPRSSTGAKPIETRVHGPGRQQP